MYDWVHTRFIFSKYIQRASITKRTTRNSQMSHIPLYETATGQRTFYFRTVELWNSLDPETDLKGLHELPEENLMLNFLETYQDFFFCSVFI